MNTRSASSVRRRRHEDRHGRPDVRAGQRIVDDVIRAGRPDGEALAQGVDSGGRGHGHQRHFAAVRLCQLERLLEQVLVVAVELERGALGPQIGVEPFRAHDGHGLDERDDVHRNDLHGRWDGSRL